MCVVVELFQEFFLFLMNGERSCRLELSTREYIERNGSAQKGSKISCKREAYPYLRGMVPYKTVSQFPCKRSHDESYALLLRKVATQDREGDVCMGESIKWIDI